MTVNKEFHRKFTKITKTLVRVGSATRPTSNLRVLRVLPAMVVLLSIATAQGASAQNILQRSAQKYLATAEKLNPGIGIPRATLRNGEWTYSSINEWTSGFYAGTLWYLYAGTHDPRLEAQAIRWTLPLANVPFGSFSHDLGFQFNTSFVNAYIAATVT